MEPLPGTGQSSTRARRLLVAAAAIQASIFVYDARKMVAGLFAPRAAAATAIGGRFVKYADTAGYYAWLRSPLIDGDFEFADEFAATDARTRGGRRPPTATGHTPNPWPVGPALLWAPAVVAVHGLLLELGKNSPWQADGYAPPYQLAVGGTTFLLSVATLLMTYRIARRFAGPVPAAAGAAVMMLGTSLIAYGATEPAMAHGPAAAALAAFVLYWLRTFGGVGVGRWLGVGALLGVVCLMRWQLATFAILPAFEAAWLVARSKDWSNRVSVASRLVVAGVAALVVFIPQLAAKQIVYGHPLGGLHQTAQNWLTPSLWAVLGSTDRSFFYWTPLTSAGLAGLVFLGIRRRTAPSAILALAAAAQVYTVAALLGGEAFLGWSFGFRFLTETCVLAAVGLAALLAAARPPAFGWLTVGAGLLVGWNLLLLGVYRHCVQGEEGAGPAELVAMAARYVCRFPGEAALMFALAGFLTVSLRAAFADLEQAREPRQPFAATLTRAHASPR